MILADHADAAYLNVIKYCSLAVTHIILSEKKPVPHYNGPILTISHTIKFFMLLASEAELAGLFIVSKYMVPLHQTLIEIGWPQPRTSIQTDNLAASGVTNNTIVAICTKSMDICFYRICCRKS